MAFEGRIVAFEGRPLRQEFPSHGNHPAIGMAAEVTFITSLKFYK